MGSMFSDCFSLTSLDLSKFNTANVTSMSSMFSDCSSLTSLDLSKFNTANVEYMYNMFFGCSALTELDLSGFDVTKVRDTEQMFYGCSALATIYCEDNWSLLMTSLYDDDDMFSGCTALVGGKGSEYDENFVGITAARPDKATKAPGYFTSRKEIYAVLSGTTMTLYYDLDKASKSDVMAWTEDRGMRNVDDDICNNIKNVTLDESMKDAMPSSTSGWFFYMK
jgi:surface protein